MGIVSGDGSFKTGKFLVRLNRLIRLAN